MLKCPGSQAAEHDETAADADGCGTEVVNTMVSSCRVGHNPCQQSL